MSEHAVRLLEDFAEKEFAPGVRARAFSGDGLTVASVTIDPNGEHPLHRHVAEQIGIVLEGSMETITRDTRTKVTVGHVYRFASNVEHGVKAGPQGCRVIEVFTPPREGIPRLE